jgi:hypothetical protein
VAMEEIYKSRTRSWNFGTKEDLLIWAYETIFSWLGIKFDNQHKEQFWQAIQYDISHNQEQLYKIRLRQIMEFEVMGVKFKWWNEKSRKAR